MERVLERKREGLERVLERKCEGLERVTESWRGFQREMKWG